jgi:hypothetical protein
MRGLNLLFVLLVNAVPLYGVNVLGWSVGTILLLYWFENLLGAVFDTARIMLHRALTHKEGHWRRGALGGIDINGEHKTYGLAREYAVSAFSFTLVHGIFMFAIVFMFGPAMADAAHWRFSFHQFGLGALLIAVALMANFLVDSTTMRARSFASIKSYAQQRLGLVTLMHLTLIFGACAMVVTDAPAAVLYVLIAMKTLWDIGTAGAATTSPTSPPGRSARLIERIDRHTGGWLRALADWRRSVDSAGAPLAEDEAVRPT